MKRGINESAVISNLKNKFPLNNSFCDGHTPYTIPLRQVLGE
jgi:hypothetical protein